MKNAAKHAMCTRIKGRERTKEMRAPLRKTITAAAIQPASSLWIPGGEISSPQTPRGAKGRLSVQVSRVCVKRSEERRVGKSVDLGGRRIIKKKKTKRMR